MNWVDATRALSIAMRRSISSGRCGSFQWPSGRPCTFAPMPFPAAARVLGSHSLQAMSRCIRLRGLRPKTHIDTNGFKKQRLVSGPLLRKLLRPSGSLLNMWPTIRGTVDNASAKRRSSQFAACQPHDRLRDVMASLSRLPGAESRSGCGGRINQGAAVPRRAQIAPRMTSNSPHRGAHEDTTTRLPRCQCRGRPLLVPEEGGCNEATYALRMCVWSHARHESVECCTTMGHAAGESR